MPGLCCGVHESYAHFTLCALIFRRKSKLLKKNIKKGVREQGLYTREQGLFQRVPPVLFYVHMVDSDFCGSENLTSPQGFF